MRAIAIGDEIALAELIQSRSDHFLGYFERSLKRFGKAADAEDLLQEFWLKVWRNRKRIEPEKGAFRWLERIALNLLIDWTRKQKVCEVVFPEEMNDPKENPFDTLLAKQIQTKCLESLAPRQRLVFRLCCEQGLDPQEAALLADINPSTLRNHLAHLRKNLKKQIKAWGWSS
ncbi:MAG: sigma-70 family RNA polymerase sigma factor [Acidobacteria bacterium]|nr:sigma-70 family RNA polymerase sigma factor [Acidobacteriota bacterium]MCB9398260.1 sigma-70 family RNA polymerase sigma factor [Acidobacteriota bacterium]